MRTYSLWGVRLSPFFLKLEAGLQYLSIPYRRLPAEGSYAENLAFMLKLQNAKQQNLIKRHGGFDTDLDELPAVPYIQDPSGQLHVDSSAILQGLSEQGEPRSLLPKADKFAFLAHLIEEAFDEFGLYMVHHMRWVGSARSNTMGQLLAKEFKRALPPGGPALLARSFPKRQVQRCPYLFSVAPKHYSAGVKRALTPPSRKGFPETHTLLNQSWKRYIKAVNQLVSKQPYLLGDRFTIADASAYGQLAMNLVDREAADQMLRIAPDLFNWLIRIQHGQHACDHQQGALYASAELKDLLNTIMGTFSALMVQNEKAYDLAKESGQTLFNEKAFNKNQALYDGQVLGYPFRAVIKTFQVRVWREVKAHWQRLSETDQESLREMMEACELFD